MSLKVVFQSLLLPLLWDILVGSFGDGDKEFAVVLDVLFIITTSVWLWSCLLIGLGDERKKASILELSPLLVVLLFILLVLLFIGTGGIETCLVGLPFVLVFPIVPLQLFWWIWILSGKKVLPQLGQATSCCLWASQMASNVSLKGSWSENIKSCCLCYV